MDGLGEESCLILEAHADGWDLTGWALTVQMKEPCWWMVVTVVEVGGS